MVPCSMFAMEPQDLEAAQPKPPANDIVVAIRAGKTNRLHQLLQVPAQEQTRAALVPLVESVPTNIDQVTSALGFTNSELAAQQQQLAKQVGDQLLSRYKPVLIPAGITAASIASLIASAIALHNQVVNPSSPQSPDSLMKGALAYSIVQSFLAALGAGYKTGVQIRKGWCDHRQHKIVEQLQNTQLLLTMLQKQATNPDGTPNQAILAEIAKEQGVMTQLTIAGDKAAIAAQQADADAAALDSQDTAAASQPAQSSEQAPVTRSLLTRGHDRSTEKDEQTQGAPIIASQFDASSTPLTSNDGAPAAPEDSNAALARVDAPAPDAGKPVVSLQDVIADESTAAHTGTNADQVLASKAIETTIQGSDAPAVGQTAIAQQVQEAAQELAQEEEQQVLAVQAATQQGAAPDVQGQATDQEEAAPQDISAAIVNLKLVAAEQAERYQREAQETAAAPQQEASAADAQQLTSAAALTAALDQIDAVQAPQFRTDDASADLAPSGKPIDWNVVNACMDDVESSISQPREQEAAQATQQEQEAPQFGIMPATMALLKEEQQKHAQEGAAASATQQQEQAEQTEAPQDDATSNAQQEAAQAEQAEASAVFAADTAQADGAASNDNTSSKKDE